MEIALQHRGDLFVSLETRHKKFAQEPIAIRASVVVLGVIVLLCAGLLVPLLWTAVVEDWQSHANSHVCDRFNDVAAQQNCYQRLRDRAAQHPAKGAPSGRILTVDPHSTGSATFIPPL